MNQYTTSNNLLHLLHFELKLVVSSLYTHVVKRLVVGSISTILYSQEMWVALRRFEFS